MENLRHRRADLADWTVRLEEFLVAHQRLWRPSPMADEGPLWRDEMPAVAAALEALTDSEVEHCWRDEQAARHVVASVVPDIAQADSLTALASPIRQREVPRRHDLDCDVPGRKARQIRAMLESISATGHPIVDWCGGKGHLGRRLAQQWQVAVTTVDRDEDLCREGRRLAVRTHVEQTFLAADVGALSAGDLLCDAHAVALHACGDLHRALAVQAAQARTPALDIVPCCFHLAADAQYRYLSAVPRLPLTRLEARIAVSDQTTSTNRERAMRDRVLAWKLGFRMLARHIHGIETDAHLRDGDKQWMRVGFAEFCQALAARRGFAFPDATPWDEGLTAGWSQVARVRRWSIPRLAIRRALEVYLALDLAQYLAGTGYDVVVRTLCDPQVTPRNILVSARLTAC